MACHDGLLRCLQVDEVVDGTITGATLPANANWQTILPKSANKVNMGGNIETTKIGAGPTAVSVAGIDCRLTEVCSLHPPQNQALARCSLPCMQFSVYSQSACLTCRMNAELNALPCLQKLEGVKFGAPGEVRPGEPASQPP